MSIFKKFKKSLCESHSVGVKRETAKTDANVPFASLTLIKEKQTVSHMIVTPMSSPVQTKKFLSVGPRTPPEQCRGSLEQDTELTNSHIGPWDELETHPQGTCIHPYAGGICNTQGDVHRYS